MPFSSFYVHVSRILLLLGFHLRNAYFHFSPKLITFVWCKNNCIALSVGEIGDFNRLKSAVIPILIVRCPLSGELERPVTLFSAPFSPLGELLVIALA